MFSHMALSREGHLEQVLSIFAYLDRNHNTEMVLEPSDPQVDMNEFIIREWTTSKF